MFKHNRHLLFSSVTTKANGLVPLGSRLGARARLKVGAGVRPVVGVQEPAHGNLRPFATPKSGLDMLVIPNPVLNQMRAFYDATQVAGQNPPLPGLEYLGWGYNIFGTYAEPSQLKWPLLDLAAQPLSPCAHPYGAYKTFDFVTPAPPLLKTMTTSFYGLSAAEYLDSLNVRAGLSGPFSGFVGSITCDYSQAEVCASTNILFRTRTILGEMALHLDLGKFKNALSAEARGDLDGVLAPKDLFDKYGGYFLSGIVVGGKTYMNWLANRYAFASTSSVRLDAEVAFKKLIGLDAGVTSQGASHFLSVASASGVTTVGGNEELGGGRVLEPGGMALWMESVEENPVFVDFTDPMVWTPLTPIWELCANATRKEQLRKAFETYAKDHAFNAGLVPAPVEYGIGIQTSTREDAGTDANVALELIGKDGRRTGLLALGNNPHLFERGNQDYFVKSALDVGEIEAVRLSHDNTGHKPGWFVEMVRIICMERFWEFPINHWIAKDEAPKRTDITFDRTGAIVG